MRISIILPAKNEAEGLRRTLPGLRDLLPDAELIVVGSRSGVRASMREYFGGSVAVHLAHRQHRPVVIVPLAARAESPLPWEEA